jgi:hypothetical protein
MADFQGTPENQNHWIAQPTAWIFPRLLDIMFDD